MDGNFSGQGEPARDCVALPVKKKSVLSPRGDIVAMTVFQGYLVVATSYGVYYTFSMAGPFTQIPFVCETQK
jgi:hypothetical protein